ncbi:MAG TPA: transcription termination/antitermination NusG family protein [Gemmataceae bacterium]|nr:transcription termination/antitermination NusG family protein [Gemmataceae bacterium]
MPLVPLDISLFPSDLLTRPASDAPGTWWVLHTRPRAEKTLAQKLLARGVSFYLPLHHKEWRSRGRLLTTDVPLFPGYLFLHGDEESRLQALETNVIVNCLTVGDQGRLRDDLVRVHRLIEMGAALTPESRLQPGTPVEIVKGPFLGLRGTVLRCGNKMKFVIEVEFLHQGVSVEVEGWMIQVLDSPKPLDNAG